MLLLSKTSPPKLVFLLFWVGPGRMAEQEVMRVESVVLINNFCSGGDALLSNVDPPVWWHMLIKSAAGRPLYPNLLVSKWILSVPVCVFVCLIFRISVLQQFWQLSQCCVCVCLCTLHDCACMLIPVYTCGKCVHVRCMTSTSPNLHINIPHLNTPLIGW